MSAHTLFGKVPIPPDEPSTISLTEHSAVEFGVSADGFPVARIGDITLAMLSLTGGGGFLASAWRVGQPLGEMTRAHFYSHEGRLADEAAFRGRVLETAEHKRQLAVLDRQQRRTVASTPWGASQIATVYADGCLSYDGKSWRLPAFH